MKKIITLLLTLALALSVCAMPAAAAVDTTEIKANFDVDSLTDVTVGTNLINYRNTFYATGTPGYFTYNGSDGFLKVEPGASTTLTVEEEDGNKVVAIEKSASTADSSKPYAEFTFLPSFSSNTSNTTGQETVRSSDVAFSFKVKLPDNATAFIYTGGQNSSDTAATAKQDGMTLLAYTKNQVNTNVRVLDNCVGSTSTSSYDDVTEDVNTFLRNEWTEFKVIYNYESGNSTFDFYVNDRLLAEDYKLYYPNFLLNFCVRIYLNSGSRPKAYIDDIQLYSVADNDTKVQPNAAKSGNGTVTVAKADTVATKDEEITYTITPDSGSYISSVTYGGTAIPAFDASGVTYKENADGKKLSVIFRDYEESAPVLMVSPFKFKATNYEGEELTYLFMKLLKNGLDVPEYGMVMSTTVEEPTAENARVVPFTNTLHQYGYYGYEVVNNSDVQDQSFYVRPYAKVGNEYIYGNVQLVEPANILN